MAYALFAIAKRVKQPQTGRVCNTTQYSNSLQISVRHEIAPQTIFTILNIV